MGIQAIHAQDSGIYRMRAGGATGDHWQASNSRWRSHTRLPLQLRRAEQVLGVDLALREAPLQ